VAEAARDTLGSVVAIAEQMGGETGAALLAVARPAFVQGLQVLSIIAAVVMAALALMVVIVLRDAHVGGEEEPRTQRGHSVPGAPAHAQHATSETGPPHVRAALDDRHGA
jgi:DHA2 family multidrug resistance protein-like MFS transporter